MNRRSLLKLSSSASILPILLSSELGLGNGSYFTGFDVKNPNNDDLDFWLKKVRTLSPLSIPKTERPKGPSNLQEITIVYFDNKDKVFKTGSDLETGEKIPDKGDLKVLLKVNHIRPSLNDKKRFEKTEGGSLRIDLQQHEPLPSLAETLAWTAIAGLLSNKTRKFPSPDKLTFDNGIPWGTQQSIPLPGGGGRWTWNFFVKKETSLWGKIFQKFHVNKELAIPFFGLGLPGIAISALNTLDKIIGEVVKDGETEWIFKSPDTFFYSTKKAKDSFAGNSMRLKSGDYIVIPSEQASLLNQSTDKLIVKDGFIVPEKTTSLEAPMKAKLTLPEITYISLGINAETVEKS